MSLYQKPYILLEKKGNNALSYEKRKELRGENPFLTIPSIKNGTLGDVKQGNEIVFEEVENNSLISEYGLEYFIRIPSNTYGSIKEITVFDNHNHALYFWLEAYKNGVIHEKATLIHIDEHSDLWENKNDFNLDRTKADLEYSWEFTNMQCNVGNYIVPAIRTGLIGDMIRIENEFQLDENQNLSPAPNTILNIDVDFFAKELDHIDFDKKMDFILGIINKVDLITIATSPFFIEFDRVKKVLDILEQRISTLR